MIDNNEKSACKSYKTTIYKLILEVYNIKIGGMLSKPLFAATKGLRQVCALPLTLFKN